MSVWEERDLPVLRALATSEDETLRTDGWLSVTEGERSEVLGLELDGAEIHDSILTLIEAGYVDSSVGYSGGGGASFSRLQVTGRGQQALGEWPLFTEIASPLTLASFLERLAEEAPTDEEADNLHRAARYAGSVSAATLRSIAFGVTAHLARLALGLG
jgi:hypothetical protein